MGGEGSAPLPALIAEARARRSRGDIAGFLSRASRWLRRPAAGPPQLSAVAEALCDEGYSEVFSAGQWRELAGVLRRALALFGGRRDPARWLLRLKLGDALCRMGRGAEARRVWRGLLRDAAERPPEERFKLLFRLRRFGAAFVEAERVLDRGLSQPDLRVFSWPWPCLLIQNELVRRFAWPDRGPLLRLRPLNASPWPLFYAEILACLAGKKGRFERLEARIIADESRYGWMFFQLGRRLLSAGRMIEARRALRRAAGGTAGLEWRIHGYLAEIAVCLGAPKEALKQLELAHEAAGEEARAEALSWKGELLLWMGRYEEALEALDGAIRGGSLYGHCWRGAAYVCLGRPAESLRDLDTAISRHGGDDEALVWRGEAKRLLGDVAGALRDLRVPIERGSVPWALCNRALIYAELKRIREMNADIARMPPELLARAKSRLRLGPSKRLRPEQWAKVLRAILQLVRGYRRGDKYGNAVWRTAAPA